MSEARHTDGPWQLESDDEGEYVVGSDGETIALLSNDVMDDGQREADARLIAAAPALLEAAQAALKYIAHCCEPSCNEGDELEDGTIDDGTISEANLLRAAIAKATGQPAAVPGGEDDHDA